MHALHKLLLFHVLTCFGRDGSTVISGIKPPMNSVQYMASLQNKCQHVCNGFLIREDFVLTAAHCNDDLTHVVLGTHDLSRVDIGKIRCIEKIYTQPDYGDSIYGIRKYIMLLKLSEKVQLDDNVQTIQLPTSNNNISENEKCQVAGWRMTGSHGPVDELRVLRVSTTNKYYCMPLRDLLDNIICTDECRPFRGICQPDSGSPLVCNGKAVGIVSLKKENVYIDISKFLPWINDILKQNNR